MSRYDESDAEQITLVSMADSERFGSMRRFLGFKVSVCKVSTCRLSAGVINVSDRTILSMGIAKESGVGNAIVSG